MAGAGALLVALLVAVVVLFVHARHTRRNSHRILSEINGIRDEDARQRALFDLLQHRHNAGPIRDGLATS